MEIMAFGVKRFMSFFFLLTSISRLFFLHFHLPHSVNKSTPPHFFFSPLFFGSHSLTAFFFLAFKLIDFLYIYIFSFHPSFHDDSLFVLAPFCALCHVIFRCDAADTPLGDNRKKNWGKSEKERRKKKTYFMYFFFWAIINRHNFDWGMKRSFVDEEGTKKKW